MKQGAALARSRPVKKGKTRQRVIPHLMSLKRETGSQISARTFADLNKIFFTDFHTIGSLINDKKFLSRFLSKPFFW